MLTNLVTRRTVNHTNRALANLVSNHPFYYPTLGSLNPNWRLGSMIGLFFALQIVSGVFLAIYYTPNNLEYAFTVSRHVSSIDTNYLFRYFNANGASVAAILIYLHLCCAFYYQTYFTWRIFWHTGLTLFLVMVSTALIGYIFPWDQVGFWVLSLITDIIASIPFIGENFAHWLWTIFLNSNLEFARFFSLQYLLPFLITGLVGVHFVLLCTTAATTTQTELMVPARSKPDFRFFYKDPVIFLFFLLLGVVTVFFCHLLGNTLGHSLFSGAIAEPLANTPSEQCLPYFETNAERFERKLNAPYDISETSNQRFTRVLNEEQAAMDRGRAFARVSSDTPPSNAVKTSELSPYSKEYRRRLGWVAFGTGVSYVFVISPVGFLFVPFAGPIMVMALDSYLDVDSALFPVELPLSPSGETQIENSTKRALGTTGYVVKSTVYGVLTGLSFQASLGLVAGAAESALSHIVKYFR